MCVCYIMPMIYASESIALAAIELLVHLGRCEVLGSYRLFTLTLPDQVILTLNDAALPAAWRADPAPRSTADIGDGWIVSGRSVRHYVATTHIYRIN